MSNSPARADEAPNPYEVYYLEQAAMLSTPDEPAAPRGKRRDLESFRLAPPASDPSGGQPRSRRREIAVVLMGIVVLVIVPLIIAALYWRSNTVGS